MLEDTLQEASAAGQAERDWRLDAHELGARGERAAARNLAERGWTILGRNWQSGYGEIDIVALDPEAPAATVSLIEVKTRLASTAGEVLPEEAVDGRRRARYRDAAVVLLREIDWARDVRFEVMSITVDDDGTAHLHHVKNAFGADE